MNKKYMQVICVAGMTLLGGIAFAQSTQTTGKEVGPQVDPKSLEPYKETAKTSEAVAAPAPVTFQGNSDVTDVDYNRLQTMPEAQRKEILANPKKYRIVNQPK